jgi:hypothetical protein
VDRGKIGAMLEELQATAKLRYMVDHREKRREIFTP